MSFVNMSDNEMMDRLGITNLLPPPSQPQGDLAQILVNITRMINPNSTIEVHHIEGIIDGVICQANLHLIVGGVFTGLLLLSIVGVPCIIHSTSIRQWLSDLCGRCPPCPPLWCRGAATRLCNWLSGKFLCFITTLNPSLCLI